jgi:VWFA-related protein
MVLVPVTVVDRKGRPVLDLQQADFELLVDGLPRVIDAFEPPLEILEATAEQSQPDTSPADAGTGVGSAAEGREDARPTAPAPETKTAGGGTPVFTGPGAQPATEVPLITKSYVALVFDRYMTTYSGVARAFDALEGFLDEGGSPHQEFGLFALIHGNLRTLQPFTSDIRLLEAALKGAYQDARQFDNWLSEEGGRQAAVVSSHMKCDTITMLSEIQAQRGRNVLNGLESLARAMAELKGRKSVVLLTDGVRLRAGLNYAYILNGMGGGAGYSLEYCTTLLLAEYRRMTRTFKTANVTLSPVSMMGLTFVTPGDPHALDELLNSSKFMAEETGGRVPLGLNDFQGELSEAVEQPLRSYVLGFQAMESAPGTAHAIEVRVNRKRVRVTARNEYVELSETFEVDSRFSSALLFPGRDHELQGEAALFTLPATKKRRELHIQVALPGEALAWLAATEGRRQAELQVNGLLRDERDRADEVFQSAYVVRAGPGKPPSRLVIQESVLAEVKRPSELVLVALDQISGMVSSWAIPIAGPRMTKAPMLITEPILLAPAGASQVISTGGDPGLSRRLHEELYLPVEGLETVTEAATGGEVGSGAGRVLVMSRIVNLPEGASVRFCLHDGRCIAAELRRDISLEDAQARESWEGGPQEGTGREAMPDDETPTEIVHAEDASATDRLPEESPEETARGVDTPAKVQEASVAPTEEDAPGRARDEAPLWSAWIKIPARALAGSDIRVEVLSAEGALVASRVATSRRGDRTAP